MDEVYDEMGDLKFGLLMPDGVELLSDIANASRDWDNAAKLYLNNARWYVPKSGRFIWEEPIGFGDGPNFYR